MFRYVLISVLIILTCSCGGGGKKGSSSTGQGEVPTDTGKRYKLGGVVKGLSGNLVIANGDDTITLDKESNFIFFKTIGEGALYDVKIVSLPTNQLCELRNSKNYAYRDHFDVVVECANLLERKININLPSKVKLADMRLLSNYQAKGGVGEESIDNNLVVYDNSVVSLRNAINQTVLLSYLGKITSDQYELNSKTTAIALMLLEPAVVSAIHDRGWLVGDVAVQLTNAVNVDGELDVLAAEVEKLVNNGGSLNSPSNTLVVALGRVLNSAIRILVSSPLVQQSQSENPSNSSVAISTTTSPSNTVGVNFYFKKLDSSSNALTLSATNQGSRYLSLRSSRFSPVTLEPLSSQDVVLNAAQAGQENFTVAITGPGILGDISDANTAGALEASIASGINQFFLPSLSILLGLNNPADFNVADCLSDNSLKALGAATLEKPSSKQFLLSDAYYKLLSDVAFSARAQFVTDVKNTNQSPIKEIFSCEKFGSGILISTKKSIAIDNTTGIINTLNSIFSSANMQTMPDLFSSQDVSYLSESIRNSYAEKEWNLSSTLKLDINANLTRVAEGMPVEFSSGCVNPSNNQIVECEITWDFGSGVTKKGGTVSNSFSSVGNYVVKATAISTLGAKQTQSIAIDVLPFKPNVIVKLASNTIKAGSMAYNFGDLDVGGKSTLSFTLLNDGFDTLNIFSFLSSDSNFNVSSASVNQLAPGAAASFNITYQPLTPGTHSGKIGVLTDDPDQSTFEFNVTGSSLGHWLLKHGNTEQSFTVVRSKTLYDNTEGSLQVRLFATQDQEYPQIRLSLKGYDINSSGKGDGIYSLNDVNNGETCLGFFGTDGEIGSQYCTSTLPNLAAMTGDVTVKTVTSTSVSKKVIFDFDALSRNCIAQASGCDSIHVSGEARYSGNF